MVGRAHRPREITSGLPKGARRQRDNADYQDGIDEEHDCGGHLDQDVEGHSDKQDERRDDGPDVGATGPGSSRS
jgi:hypothetical protein